MPATLKVAVDIGSTSRDLRALGDDLDRPIRDVLGDHAATIADLARGFLHKGAPSWPTSSAARLFPAGIRAYYGSSVATISATVWSTHPAAPVWEWGGTIHPASGAAHEIFKAHPGMAAAMGHQEIHIPRDLPVTRAGDADLPMLERDLRDAIDRLIVEYGF